MADPGYYYSINTYPGNGTQRVFEISFAGGYLSKEHVKAYIRTGSTVQDVALTWINDYTVMVEVAPTILSNIVIYRDTPKDKPLANFTDGAVVTETNLDINATQAVFIAAEALDRANFGFADFDVERSIRLDYAVGSIGGDALSNAMKLIGLDASGQPALFATDATDLSGIVARILALENGAANTPVSLAAVGGDFGALANLARAVRERAFTNIPIKFAGIGSSNMRNENGSLAGVGNSPVEVAMRAAKAMLDPFGFCIWEFDNFGVNGSAVSGYGVAGLDSNPDPRAPRAKLLFYKPDVTIVCYGTNDSAPEAWNSGQTRNGLASGYNVIADDCRAIDSDCVFLTVPSAHVIKSMVTSTKINATIPMSFPKRSFQIGQSPFTEQFSFTTTNRIVATRPVFNDAATWGYGLAVGKAVEITDANLGNTIPNTGKYLVSAIDPNGFWVEVSRKLKDDGTGYALVDDGPAVFVASGNVNATFKRIWIDSDTELVPNRTDGVKLVNPLGDDRYIRVLTRFYDANQVLRETAATMDSPSAVVDLAANYENSLVKYGVKQGNVYEGGEDRYYIPIERVHWNSVLVDEIMMPMFVAFFKALTAVIRTISNRGSPRYLRSLVVRPDAGPSDTLASIDPNRVARSSFDIQLDELGGAFRNANDAVLLEVITEPGAAPNVANGVLKRRIRGTGGYRQQRPLSKYEFNRGTNTPMIINAPSAGWFEGRVKASHPIQADNIYQFSAYYTGTEWHIKSELEFSAGAYPTTHTLNFVGDGATGELKLVPIAADNCEVFYDCMFTATVPTALDTPDA